MAQCPPSPKLGGTALEDLHSSCGRTEDEGESLEATTDQAALAYTLSSSGLEFPADADADDRLPLYRALDTPRVQHGTAASSGSLNGARVVLWTCAAATLLAFAAATAAVAIVTAKSSDELSRSMDEVKRVLQANIATKRVTVFSSAVTRAPYMANSTTSPGDEAHSASTNGLNTTGASS